MPETVQASTILPLLDATGMSTRRKSVEWEVSHEEVSQEDTAPEETSRPTSPTSGLGIFTESAYSKSTKSSSRESSPVSQPPKQTATKNWRPRNESWPNYAFHNPILTPRPYEQIYAEIGYLTGSLQVEAYNTAKLIGHYSLVQDALKGEAAVGKHRRKLRKQLSSLKCRISQASFQERTIIFRLSELHMEAQSRNTWSQVQLRRMFLESNPCSPSPKTPSTAASFHNARNMSTQLNAACSEFVPSLSTPISPNNRPRGPQAEPSVSLPQRTVTSKEKDSGAPRTPGSEGERRIKGDDGDRFQNRGLQYTYDVESEKTESPGGPNKMAADTGHEPICRRRPSLPSMKFTWPEK